MASAAAARSGAQTFNSMYFKPMLRKAYHRKGGSSEMVSDSVKINGAEVNNTRSATAAGGVGGGRSDVAWWVRDDRTGIYYPKGHEKVMEDVPQEAAKDVGTINWFG